MQIRINTVMYETYIAPTEINKNQATSSKEIN